MASSLITFAQLLKKRYTKEKVEDLTQKESPLMAKMPKDEGFQGESLEIPMIHVNPQGLAANTLAQAQTSATNLVAKKFSLTTGSYQGAVSFGDKVMKASRGNEGAFLQNRAAETDGLYEAMAAVQCKYLYGNGGGSIGVIGDINSNTFTLEEPSDVINFEEGMRLVFSDDDGSEVGHAPRAGSTFVTAVDRATGIVSVDDFGDITSEAIGDFVFRQGDFVGNSGTVLFHGLASYIWHNGTPPSLYGMTRTSDAIRLAGCRMPDADISGLSIEEKVMKLGAYMTGRYQGPGPTDAFVHPEDWLELAVALRSQGWHPAKDTSTRFGFQAIEAVMGKKLVKIYPDGFCPRGTLFALKMDNWKIHSMGKMIHPIDEDGLNILRNSTTNDYEYRLVSYMAPCTNAPGYSGRVNLAL